MEYTSPKAIEMKVVLPARYKKKLEERFTPVEGEDYIGEVCPLCREHLEYTDEMEKRGCSPCPFFRFEGKEVGCIVWMKEVLGTAYLLFRPAYEQISWNPRRRSRAIKQLTTLRERAAKLIEWES